MLHPKTRRAAAVALLAPCLSLAATHADVVVPWDGWSAPVPQAPGAGLNASMWNGLFSSLSQAEAFAASNPRDARFTATLIDYPNGDLDALANPAQHSALIGADFPSSTAPAAANAHNMVYRFDGYIAIPAAGDVTFTIGSSDGARLVIGGVQILGYEQPNGFYFRNEVARFSRAGLYPITLTYFSDWGGVTGLELHSSLPGGQGIGPAGTTGVISPGALYGSIVPAPGALALAGMGGVLVMRRRRAH